MMSRSVASIGGNKLGLVSAANISAEVAYAPTIEEIYLYGLDESGMIDKYARDLKEVEQREGKAYLVELMKQTSFGYGYGWQNWVRSTAIDESCYLLLRNGD